MQMDLIRQQLEFEAQHIRSLMEERFGTSDEMVQRAQVWRWAWLRRGHQPVGESAEIPWGRSFSLAWGGARWSHSRGDFWGGPSLAQEVQSEPSFLPGRRQRI